MHTARLWFDICCLSFSSCPVTILTVRVHHQRPVRVVGQDVWDDLAKRLRVQALVDLLDGAVDFRFGGGDAAPCVAL